MIRQKDLPATDQPSPATCACTILLSEVSAQSGRGGLIDDVVMRHVLELGITVTEDWLGNQAVFVDDARRLREAIEGFLADHDAAWRDYQRYTEAERAKALEAQRAAAARARAEQEQEQRQWSEDRRKASAEKSARDLAEAQRKAQERQGNPIPFEKFKKGKAS